MKIKADEKLERLGAQFNVIHQEKPTTSCSGAAEQRNVETSQIVKSLLIQRDDQLLHLCIPGDAELDEQKVFGHVTMVSESEAERLSGFEPGKIHPFSTKLKHLVDCRVLENNIVSFTTGSSDEGVKIEIDEFVRAMQKDEFQYIAGDFIDDAGNRVDFNGSSSLSEEEQEFVRNSGLANQFSSLSEKYEDESVLEVIEQLNRKDFYAPQKKMEEILKTSQSKNDIKILIEGLIDSGEIPDIQDSQISVEDLINEIIAQNPKAEEDLEEGNGSAINFIIGKAMEKTQGQADPEKIESILKNEYLEA